MTKELLTHSKRLHSASLSQQPVKPVSKTTVYVLMTFPRSPSSTASPQSWTALSLFETHKTKSKVSFKRDFKRPLRMMPLLKMILGEFLLFEEWNEMMPADVLQLFPESVDSGFMWRNNFPFWICDWLMLHRCVQWPGNCFVRCFIKVKI